MLGLACIVVVLGVVLLARFYSSHTRPSAIYEPLMVDPEAGIN
jgi:hypothetical protein